MKARINNIGGSLLARLSFMLFLAMTGGVCNLMAESRIYASGDFAINPGEEKVIAVNFDNGDNMTALQMDFTLPDGLELVRHKANPDRIERGVHVLSVTQQGESSKYRIFVRSELADPIPGNGELVSLTLRATEDFTSRSKIVFDNIHISNSEVPVTRIDLDPFDVLVSPEVGHIATNESAFSIKQDGTAHTVDLLLNNTIDIYGLSGRIELPAGMSFGKNNKGRIDITYGDRIPAESSISIVEGTGIFVITPSLSLENFGREGVLFSFKVVASPELAETSEIAIGEIEVSDKNGVVYSLGDRLAISVTNSYLADRVPAMEKADSLQTVLNNAIEKINTTCPNVKDSVSITTAEETIQSKINELKEAIEAAYNDETLGANKETVLAPVAEIGAAIEKLLADADAAQKAYEADEAKKAANEAANTKLKGEIAALQTQLDEAKVAVDSTDVAADFADELEAIQAQIKEIADSVQTQYEAVALTAESTIPSAEVEAAIEQLLADADAAQKAYEADEAKKAANEAANKRLTDEIAALQAQLDDAKAVVDSTDVAADFADELEALQSKINAIADSVKTQYEAVALTEESTIPSAEVEAAIEQLLADADAAQKAYEADEAKKAANEAANKRLTDEIAALQAQLDDAKAVVDSTDVAADFADELEALQSKINAIADSVKTQYEAVALTAESTIPSAEVEAAIEKLLADADAAQKAYEADEAKKAANEAANTKLKGEIAALQTQLDDAKAAVDSTDVAADFADELEALQSKINAIADSVKTQYEAVALTAESTIPSAEVGAAIEQLLTDAKAAQKAYEADEAKKAANEAANKRLTDEIAALQTKLDEAKATVDAECKDVAADFTKTEHDIQGLINQVADSVKTQYEAVALTAESTIPSADIEAAIEKLLADARAAQEAYDQAEKTTNDIAYRRLKNELAEVQDKLYAAEAKVDNECRDVSADFVETELGIQAMIDAISDDIKKQYDAKELTEESTINTAGIEAAIEKLLADAAAAQWAYEKAANEAAYDRLTDELAALQSKLDEAEATVETECKDVAADFAETVEGIQAMVDGIAADLKRQYNAIGLTEESTIDTDDVEAAIEKLLADAAEAQKAHEIQTGIDRIESLATRNAKIYTVSGKQVNALVKGQVNILVYPDGTVKRVYVK